MRSITCGANAGYGKEENHEKPAVWIVHRRVAGLMGSDGSGFPFLNLIGSGVFLIVAALLPGDSVRKSPPAPLWQRGEMFAGGRYQRSENIRGKDYYREDY